MARYNVEGGSGLARSLTLGKTLRRGKVKRKKKKKRYSMRGVRPGYTPTGNNRGRSAGGGRRLSP